MASRGKDGPAAALASRPLTASSVFVRVRPTSTKGDCGHTDGEAVNKKLASFDETSLTVQDDGSGETDQFEMTRVVPPDAEQEDTFNMMLPGLLEAFTTDCNVFFFAYGQTGSGKTHTMLGEVESLSSEEPVPGWGVFPRVVHSTLESMRSWRKEGIQSVLLATAVEFYCCCAFDLNSRYRDMKNEVTIDQNANVFGAKSKEVKSTKGLRKWIHRMYANRTTAKTDMNDASSRSHCAFILTLHKLQADDTYYKTSFSLIDMAGSERASKTGGERVTGLQASKEAGQMMQEGTPELLSVGAQGTLINMEISHITTEIQKASDMHKKGLPYKAAKECSTAASYYFCACVDGRAQLGACVTVSQSPQHGFETWFSLKYAQQLAALRVPLVRVRPVNIAHALENATKEAEEAEDHFSKMDKNPQGAKQYRSFSLARGAAAHTAETLTHLKRLVELQSGPAEADGDSDVSDAPWQSPLAPRKAHAEAPEKSALEMGKINENFSVFIRIRPLVRREVRAGVENCFVVSDVENFPRDPPPQRITVQDVSEPDARGSFVFNRVFVDSHGQDDVYRGTAAPYVADFLGGTNVTIFAYGQTGTGKTYTIAGPPEDPGIIYHCLTDIFDGLAATGKELYYDYVQLYLEGFKDLLVAEPKSQPRVVDSKDGGVIMENVTSKQATTVGQVMTDLELSASRRATRSQDMNEVSSRSHAILFLHLVAPGKAPSEADASMFIVDLAGSERAERSGVTGKGFEEATSINQSLSALGRVVIALIDRQKFVPYSAHPLTMALKSGLGGNSKTALIACVTQAADSMSESINTLRFAMQASHVKNKVAKKDAADEADKRKAAIADKGNVPSLEGGKGVISLPKGGDIEVFGSWEASEDASDRVVIILDDLNADLGRLQGIIDALASKNCLVLAPKLPGTKQAHIDEDAEVLMELLDWLGVAKPVIYGRDWGAMIACKFKLAHPPRVGTMVLEEFTTKLGPKEYKALETKDMMKAYGAGAFLWFWDGAFPTSGDLKPGKNLQRFKPGKVVFLWPFQTKGKHDPRYLSKKGMPLALCNGIAKILKTTAVDSYLMTDEEYANTIASCFKS